MYSEARDRDRQLGLVDVTMVINLIMGDDSHEDGYSNNGNHTGIDDGVGR